jgi:nitrate reductase (NAD(P)H)
MTLICDGNRRKELNKIKPSAGFSWGPAAIGNMVWTGVSLKWILEVVCEGISQKDAQNRDSALGKDDNDDGDEFWVTFEGADILPKGTYASCLPLAYVISETSDILLAYAQNGEDLRPDHGYPLRLIVPGYVGGRMVKWLKRIIVSKKETESWYYWRDNRVLPPNVGSVEEAEVGILCSAHETCKEAYIYRRL